MFENKNVLITGGLGFIGSNLAIKLVELGAKVTIADAMIPEYGGNLFNVEPIKDKIHINFTDIRSETSMEYLVRNQDYIFHLAGQVSHIMSLSNPFPDIDINIKGTAVIMEALKKFNRDAIVVYTGTRGQYGSAVSLPVNEEAPLKPKGIYEISNLAAEQIVKVYNDVFGIRSVLLRLTNIYGPRAQMKHSKYNVANWFIRLAIDNEVIKVFGDGSLKRDFLYVDDCVDAIIKVATNEKAYGEIFNVGVDKPVTILEFVKKVIEICGTGKWEFAPYTPERLAQEPGDYYSDITKIRTFVNWGPKTLLEEGIKKTIEYYKKYKKYYW
uniref:NAD-dependent epimerase/dehydratase family protein n=1 Tax=candidate division WOR-3 bacterium TaxID=2052148 RepID=A0A7C4YH28_UNCW3